MDSRTDRLQGTLTETLGIRSPTCASTPSGWDRHSPEWSRVRPVPNRCTNRTFETCRFEPRGLNEAIQALGYRLFASGFTNSRTDSMNICATGLSDRFFKVVMPTGCRMLGSLTGSALSPGCFRGRRSEKLTTTVRKRSVASSSFRRIMEVASTVSRGGSRLSPACADIDRASPAKSKNAERLGQDRRYIGQ